MANLLLVKKTIYNIVLAAQQAVEKAMKPGVEWKDMHILSENVIVQGLIDAGILRGTVEEMNKEPVWMGAVFMPHGLGHLLGIDTHDAGGYLKGMEREKRPGLKSLRCGRKLEKGMVITVEPGVYFIDHLLDEALANEEKRRFLVVEELEKYRGFGGVRLEDDVVVTEDGMENLTLVPRTVEDIENLMSSNVFSAQK
eukprot:TRINITY_DN513_c0_g3_i1.p3 TRINITY_DN513_c0_g3~~TRINITY_DN513_c0_g3_i1.p3  ORF type:complete len:197 (-),score=76.34 TRINITY_DN513_c0_g3_i1:840-1430(-)